MTQNKMNGEDMIQEDKIIPAEKTIKSFRKKETETDNEQ